MAEGQPQPANESDTVYLFRFDPVSNLPIIIGKVFIDENEDAWVRINATDLAEGIGVKDIDGVVLLNRDEFNVQEPE